MTLEALWAAAQTGGTTGAVDKIPTADVTDKDMIHLISPTLSGHYTVDDDSGAAEAAPWVINFDDETGDQRAVLVDTVAPNSYAKLFKGYDTNFSNTLTYKWNEDDSSDRTLNLKVNSGDRTIDLSSDLTIPAAPGADRILFWDHSALAHKYLTPGTGLSITDTSLNASTQYTDEMAQDAVGAMVADTTTIDVTYTDETPELKWDVKDSSITYAKIQNVSATDKLLGRTSAGAGVVEEVAFTDAGQSMVAAADAAAQLALVTPLTTRGDIMFRNATVSTRLAKGADNTILAMGADDPEWKTPATILADLSGQAGAAFDLNGKALTGVTSATLSNAGWIGIGAALERLEFYEAGYASIMGANFGIGTATPGAKLHLDSLGDDANAYFADSIRINHGMTDLVPTDVYGLFSKWSGGSGGVSFGGFSESGSVGGLLFQGVSGDTPTVGVVTFRAGKKSGTTYANVTGTDRAFDFQDIAGSNTFMAILGNGNVGIGTTSPGYKLEIETGSVNIKGHNGVDTGLLLGGNLLAITSDGTDTTVLGDLLLSGYLNLLVTDIDGDTEGDIWYDNSEDKLKVYTPGGVKTITFD